MSDAELLRSIIGDELWHKVHTEFAGTTIYIPAGTHEQKKELHKQIYQEFQNGTDYRELAKKHKLTVGHIKTIIKVNHDNRTKHNNKTND